MKKLALKTLFVLSFVFVAGFIYKTDTFAIPVSPDKYYLDVDYGQTKNEKLTIYGREELASTKKIFIYVFGMRKVGEDNARQFYKPDPNNQGEAANWIKLAFTEATLAPGETVEVPWTLNPSEQIGCGTNLAAIIVTSAPPTEENVNGEAVVSFKEEVVSQVHVNTAKVNNGECPNNAVNLQLLDFYIDKTIPVFNYDQVPFVTRIENKGNLISRGPKGFIEIFGFGEKITLDFNGGEVDIYPNTIRRFDNEWEDEKYPHEGSIFSKFIYELTHVRFGKYNARLGITKNVQTQIVKEVSFWIIPWKVIIILLLVVITIGLLAYKNLKANRELKSVRKSSAKVEKPASRSEKK